MTVAGIATSPLSELEHRVQLRRAVIASTIGTTIEWYDFFLYSTVTGLVFAKLYFPGSDPLVGTLQAFGIYAVGFVARPVGAAIFGHYGDRIGRKAALIATLLLMGIATFLVAFVPTYAQIGVWGAIILTVLRFVQGIGVGGEWGGSVLLSMEWARSDHHRGFIAAYLAQTAEAEDARKHCAGEDAYSVTGNAMHRRSQHLPPPRGNVPFVQSRQWLAAAKNVQKRAYHPGVRRQQHESPFEHRRFRRVADVHRDK